MKGSEVDVLAMFCYTWTLLFFSVYVNFTKEWRKITQKWALHHHLNVLWSPWGQSLYGHLIPTRQPSEYCKNPKFLLWDFKVTSTSSFSDGLKQGFSELLQCQYLSFLSMVVKQVPLRIYSLRFALEEFWGSPFRHKEVTSQWLSIFPQQNGGCCFQSYPVASSQHTQPPVFNAANVWPLLLT